MTVTERLDWGVDRETETAAWSRLVAGATFSTIGGLFLTATMLAAAMVPGYVVRESTLVDLGVAPASAVLFNLSMLAVGILTAVGGYMFYRSHGTPWLLGLYSLAALGAFGVGVFPQNYGVLHVAFVVLALVCYNLAAVGTGVRIRGPMVVVSVLLGAVGLLFLAVLAVGDTGNAALFEPLGRGGTERMVLYAPMLWLVIFGGYLLGSRREHREWDDGAD